MRAKNLPVPEWLEKRSNIKPPFARDRRRLPHRGDARPQGPAVRPAYITSPRSEAAAQ